MPRDKTFSHKKVNKAIKEEFLEKGFQGASIRSIGERAGMSSAGLYRHYPDKEAMFGAMVDPLIDEIKAWTHNHMKRKYSLMDAMAKKDDMFGESFLDMIREVILPQREEFILLMQCSAGTRYVNFIHDFVVDNQHEFWEAILYMKKQGYPIVDIEEEELHMLLSAFLTACFEPIIHNYDETRIKKYLDTLQEFFMPGWMRIMGLN